MLFPLRHNHELYDFVVIVLKNFQLFAMEAGAQATVATSSVGGRSGKGEGDGGSCAKKKQLLIYTLLDLMHKSDFFFIVRIADIVVNITAAHL